MSKKLEGKLTFGDLEKGEFFISFPVDGDNDGHGGYLGAHYIFQKTGEKQAKRYYLNLKSYARFTSSFPESMDIIKIE